MGQWKLVPMKPTRAMLVAAHMIERDDVELTEDEHRAMYEAFLSAAPSPDGEEDEVERVATALGKLDGAGFEKLGPITGLPLDTWRSWEPQARAAISAMRPKQHHAIGKWLSAALEDPSTCEEMKEDIRAWFAAGEPSPVRPTLSEEDRARVEEVRERHDEYKQGFMDHIGEEADADRAILLSLIDKLANQEPTDG